MKEGKFYLKYATKSIVEDDYENGENPDTEYNIDLDCFDECFCDSIEDMVKPLGLDFKDEDGWTVFDDGRLIYQRIENDNGDKASDYEIEMWKYGKKVLYSAEYNFYVLFMDNIRTPKVGEMVEKFGIESYD